ncbi:MAG: CDP-diacylglycerol--serine O-phosphatidyltransferase [Myxococcota bacterium]
MSLHPETREVASSERPARRRRRRRRSEDRPSRLYLLPHLLTTGNLFFGFYAIVHAFTGDPDKAALGIILAACFDTLDGRVARLTRSTSRFGVQYDSIADTVSFGVAPAMLAFSAAQLTDLGRPGWLLAFLYTACGALRLARFNVTPGRYKGWFEGMPSPAAAGIVASTQWFVSFLRDSGMPVEVPPWLVGGGVAALGLLMVSAIPYRSSKELDLRHSFGTLVFVVVALALVIAQPSVTLFCIGIAYAVSGPAEWLWRRAAHKPLERIPEPATTEPFQG